MSTKSAKVDRLIREHLTLNEGLLAQSREKASAPGNPVSMASGGQAAATKMGRESSATRVTEIRQELVQIMRTAPADKT